MDYYCIHTHSKFCDGASTLREMTEAAIQNGVKILGFSAHNPIHYENDWSLKVENYPAYVAEINRLKQEYKGKIILLAGMEADYTPGLSYSEKYLRQLGNLDYVIGSIHLVKKSDSDQIWYIDGPSIHYETGLDEIYHFDIKSAVADYYSQVQEMIVTQKPDLIGHVDKVRMHNRNRYFHEDESWYVAHVEKTIEIIRQSGIVVEVNTRGIYKGRSDSLFPGRAWLERFNRLNIPVTVSTDAHQTSEIIKGYDSAVAELKEIGFNNIVAFDGTKWNPVAI